MQIQASLFCKLPDFTFLAPFQFQDAEVSLTKTSERVGKNHLLPPRKLLDRYKEVHQTQSNVFLLSAAKGDGVCLPPSLRFALLFVNHPPKLTHLCQTLSTLKAQMSRPFIVQSPCLGSSDPKQISENFAEKSCFFEITFVQESARCGLVGELPI
mmetsp:Transcript_18336/g.60232  ORF Transcript_18336/g.60232 Transcript_18336/m.60232 type:complete len:155 (-) Transcript_18336:689-1153(-)